MLLLLDLLYHNTTRATMMTLNSFLLYISYCSEWNLSHLWLSISNSLSEPHPPGLQVVGPLQVPVGPHDLYSLNLTRFNPGPLQTVVLRNAIKSHGLSLQNSVWHLPPMPLQVLTTHPSPWTKLYLFLCIKTDFMLLLFTQFFCNILDQNKPTFCGIKHLFLLLWLSRL